MLTRKSTNLRSLITLLSLSLLASCSNSKALESFINADPQLQAQENLEKSSQNSTPQNEREVIPQPQNKQTDPEPEILNPATPEEITNLPEEIPQEIPIYPQAKLQQIEPELTPESGSLILRSPDQLNEIAKYYQEQLQTQEWEITQPFSLEENGNSQSARPSVGAVAIANKDNLKIKISLANSSVSNEENDFQTEINLTYQPLNANLTAADLESTGELEIAPDITENSPDKPEIIADKTPVTKTVTNFSDLGEVREQLQQAVKDVAALGILTPQTKDSPDQFAPNELVTRRDYARWLVSANNKFHNNSPGKKIHLTKNASQKAFNDIDAKDPDFGAIQGLAEAGLIPSILTNDSDNVLFRPDATLTREDLVTWKVPLDVRAALSKASIETIEETWGFQDAAKIDPLAIKALFSDFQNGDRANVRRLFGYTTLFQPKKGVTRAEAAASLWYFGFQGDGISAEEILSLVDN